MATMDTPNPITYETHFRTYIIKANNDDNMEENIAPNNN